MIKNAGISGALAQKENPQQGMFPGMFTAYVGSRNGKNRIFSLNVLLFADKLITMM
jgi:hypothetical protein